MRKFILSSDKYDGECTLIYNEQDKLCAFEVGDLHVPDQHKAWLIRHLPYELKALEAFLDNIKVFTAVEAEMEASLDDFKREYPYARNMHLLPDIWAKMKKAEQFHALRSAKEYRKYCERNNAWYKPKIAAAWLKAKEYLNNWKQM